MAEHHYLIALGSNRPHGGYGRPKNVIKAAIDHLAAYGMTCVSAGPIGHSSAIGPSRRRFANTAIWVASDLPPEQILASLQKIERDFGRRRGQRWAARVLDLDIILWSGGLWQSPTLSIPHPHWQGRRFVTDPLMAIAGDWRDPLTGLRIRHIAARLSSPKPVKRR